MQQRHLCPPPLACGAEKKKKKPHVQNSQARLWSARNKTTVPGLCPKLPAASAGLAQASRLYGPGLGFQGFRVFLG